MPDNGHEPAFGTFLTPQHGNFPIKPAGRGRAAP
jgi:hypothetical protein